MPTNNNGHSNVQLGTGLQHAKEMAAGDDSRQLALLDRGHLIDVLSTQHLQRLSHWALLLNTKEAKRIEPNYGPP